MGYIPDSLRRRVVERANSCCEYCGLPQIASMYPHEVDHIIAEKHRGETTSENLCLSCLECKRHKGSDFGSFDPETGDVALLYHPRKDRWEKHFTLKGETIEPLSPTGRVTVFVLQLNAPQRLRERLALIKADAYTLPQQTP